ncbi:MAG: hypothetical protein M3509_09730 [Chloroflexota bacterium]|nr:hypothetical protein [Chloroflexota bacterium]
MDRLIGQVNQGATARSWRRRSLALVLLIAICSGHWASFFSEAPASPAVTRAFESREPGNGLGHELACVIDSASLATDQSRFDVEAIVPADAGGARLAPTFARSCDHSIETLALTPGARRAVLQVFLI